MTGNELETALAVVGELLDGRGNDSILDDMQVDAHPHFCSWCGIRKTFVELGRYRYLGHDDRGTAVNLCGECNTYLAEDPRRDQLTPLVDHEPWPGVDVLCGQCVHRRGLRCTSRMAALNGGPGIRFEGGKPSVFAIWVRDHETGEYRLENQTIWTPRTACDGRRVTRQ